MDWVQAGLGLLAVALALPAVWFAARAARYSRDTVMVSALESDLRRVDEAEDRLERLNRRFQDYGDGLTGRGERFDFGAHVTPAVGEWQISFLRLPRRVRDELLIDSHYPDQLGIPMTGAEGWSLDSPTIGLDALQAFIRTVNQDAPGARQD